MKKTIKALLLVGGVFLLTGCGGVKLDTGENAVVTFNEGGISANELYQQLKETYGAENIVNLIDKFLLEKKYKKTAEETKYVNQSLNTAEDSAAQYNVDVLTYINYYYGLSSISAFKDYIALNYKRSLWIEDYGKETVTDTQINEYYETESVGDMTISHILIAPTSTDDMTDDEKKTAEDEALNKAKEIITKLDNKEDFATLAKEYSADEETASNGGSLGEVNVGDYDDSVIDAAKALEIGSYTISPIKSTYGYHIIYKTAQKEKPTLDDTLKDEIREIVGKEIAKESSFYMKALLALREKNGIKFEDTELETSYNKYIEKNSQQQSN